MSTEPTARRRLVFILPRSSGRSRRQCEQAVYRRDYTAIKPRAVRRAYSVHPTKMGRKRQRSTQVALTDDDEQPVAESESTPDLDRGSTSQADELPEERKKELDVWDAFKEEHHEGPFPTHRRRVHRPTSLISRSSRTAAIVVASPVQADARIGFSERGYASGWSSRIYVSDTFGHVQFSMQLS